MQEMEAYMYFFFLFTVQKAAQGKKKTKKNSPLLDNPNILPFHDRDVSLTLQHQEHTHIYITKPDLLYGFEK